MTSSNDGGFVFMDIDNDNEAIDFARSTPIKQPKSKTLVSRLPNALHFCFVILVKYVLKKISTLTIA